MEMPNTVVTCDQAIYDIVKGFTQKNPEKYNKLILRLGGFHIAENYKMLKCHLLVSEAMFGLN